VYPRAENGRYLEAHVIAAVEADAKVHAQIAQAAGVTELPDDVSAKIKDVPTAKRTEIESKAAALKADTKDVTADTPIKVVVDRLRPVAGGRADRVRLVRREQRHSDHHAVLGMIR
jgi:hypothetical protein